MRDAASATGSPTRGSGLPICAITTSFVYDTQGRLTKITDPGAASRTSATSAIGTCKCRFGMARRP